MTPEFAFAEIVTGGARNRGGVHQVESILSLDYYGKNAPVDAYSSAYLHSEEYAAYRDEQGGKRGYNGAVKAEFLHFDFDSPHDDLALLEVRTFTEKLCSADKYGLSIEDFKWWYSGNKGFHVFIIAEEVRAMPGAVDIPDKVKRYAVHLAGDYSTFDRSVYDRTRIFRIPNSKHGKTGLFKVPLLAGEVWTLTLEEIKELAKNQRSIETASKLWLDRIRKAA